MNIFLEVGVFFFYKHGRGVASGLHFLIILCNYDLFQAICTCYVTVTFTDVKFSSEIFKMCMIRASSLL